MALSDPLSITVAGNALSFPRVSVNGNSTVYRTADGLFTTTISHQYGANSARRMIRLDQRKLAADPFIPAQNRYVQQSFWTLNQVPTVGFTVTESKDLAKALLDFESASTYAALLKVLGGES